MPVKSIAVIRRIDICPAGGSETRIECEIVNPSPQPTPPLRVRIQIFTPDDRLFQTIPISIPPIPPRSSHTSSRFVRMRRPEPFRFKAKAEIID